MPAWDEPEVNPWACLLLAVTVALIGVTAESARVLLPPCPHQQLDVKLMQTFCLQLVDSIDFVGHKVNIEDEYTPPLCLHHVLHADCVSAPFLTGGSESFSFL